MAMRCSACKRRFEDDLDNCPHCGEPVRAKPVAMLKTSTILISSNDTESVYRSVRDIPEPLAPEAVAFHQRLECANHPDRRSPRAAADRAGHPIIARDSPGGVRIDRQSRPDALQAQRGARRRDFARRSHWRTRLAAPVSPIISDSGVKSRRSPEHSAPLGVQSNHALFLDAARVSDRSRLFRGC